ncbi:MAG TPA: M48 family metallopeptidase [Anaeromyxobacteraceae bacterium]|nr:M48 family metallopeptidase [Anaeromyxobacteraceae bacterium]
MAAIVAGAVAVALLVQYLVETALIALNVRHARTERGVPERMAAWYDDGAAEQSRAYVRANGLLAMARNTWDLAVILVMVFSGVLPHLDRALSSLGLRGPHLFVVFLGLVTMVHVATSAPVAAFQTFVIEQRFGFNRTTPATWIADKLRSMALVGLFGVPFLYAVYAVVTRSGRLWWLWIFALMAGFQVFMLWLWPTFIAPLFNRFQPLPQGELKARLDAMADAAGFHNRGLFVMDASRRSGHANAWFAGIFRPRIVLFDTFLAQTTPDEAAAVLAHEIGHFKRSHVKLRLLWSLAATLGMLWLLSLLVPWRPLYDAFGFAGPSLHAATALVTLAGGAFLFWMTPVASWLSRRHEYEADRFAMALCGQPEALASSLVRLHRSNLSNVDPHPWFSAWHYSHPTLADRLAAIEREEARIAVNAAQEREQMRFDAANR